MLDFVNETDNKNFYPTPLYLINRMEQKVKNWDYIESILEPSAGKGDIVNVLKQRKRYSYSDKNFDIDCIEIDPNLQMILKGNGFKVVHDDFLNYNGYKNYQLIMMNPPFDCGDRHLLKALDMQKRGGQIVCLLNAETLLNPCTNIRKDLLRKLTELEADIEFIEDGFVNAERKSKVKTALVYVNIKDDKIIKDDSFIVDNLNKAREKKENYEQPTEITDKLDYLEQIVQQFNFEVEGSIKLIREYEAFKPYMKSSFTEDRYSRGSILNLRCGDDEVKINSYLKLVRSKYWGALFTNEEFTKNLTSNLVKEYREHIQKLCDYDFTMFNIKSIQLEMSKNMIQGVEDTILKLFEEFSNTYHWYDEMSNNVHYYNGWKTNKCYMVNKKVIIPLSGYRDLSYSFGGYDPTQYDVKDKLSDIEKVFNYLDGGLTPDMNLQHELNQAKIDNRTKKVPLKYFTVTFYKKGTCHIEFTNEELLKKFNIYGGRGKNWLPPSYGKKKYTDMTQEEKTVIDNFEGEKEYAKVLSKQQYYLADTINLLSLPETI